MKSNTRWKHRRALVYAVTALSFGMIVVGPFVWDDGMVASEAIRSATALITIVLTSYVFGAALDDKWQRRDDAPSDY